MTNIMKLDRRGLISEVWVYVQLSIGALLGALSVVVFLVPADVAPQGITGIATFFQELFGVPPIGLGVILLNIPIQYLGYRMLPGGWQMIARSIFVIVLYAVLIDVLTPMVPEGGFSEDRMLNALFGGIIGGISGGVVYRTGATFGGTSTLAMILRFRTGVPMSTTFLYTDTAIVIVAGLIYGVEGALYAMVVLFLGGIASDYVMEGPAVIRTAIIVTDKPQEVSQVILSEMHRGVTSWDVTGMYSGRQRGMLFVTISRSQVPDLRRLVEAADESAFMVIGHGHNAYGQGFRRRQTDKHA